MLRIEVWVQVWMLLTHLKECIPRLFSECDGGLFQEDQEHPISPYLKADTAAVIADHFSCTNLLWPGHAGRQQNSSRLGKHNCILGRGEGGGGGGHFPPLPLPSCRTPPWVFLPSCLASWAIRSAGSSCVAPGQLFPLHASCAAHSCGEMMSYLLLWQAECVTAQTRSRGWGDSTERHWAGFGYTKISDDLGTSYRKRETYCLHNRSDERLWHFCFFGFCIRWLWKLADIKSCCWFGLFIRSPCLEGWDKYYSANQYALSEDGLLGWCMY